jgi:hypothetical protein
MKNILIFGAIALTLSSCTVGIRGASVSVRPLKGSPYTVVAAKVTATECATLVFGSGEPPSVSKIVAGLVSQNNGDDAINVEFEQRSEILGAVISAITGGIVTQTCAKVTADIIKY